MAEPVKIKFEYQNPDNVQSEVPGEQKLREDASENENEAVQKRTMRRNHSYSGAQESTIDHARLNRRYSNVSNTSTDDKTNEKKTRTKIPVSRFRQTVEKVKAERRGLVEKKNQEPIPTRRSSILKATGRAPTKPVRKSIPAKTKAVEVIKTEVIQSESTKTEDAVPTVAKPENSEPTVTKTEAIELIACEDEFDKLYEEVVHSLTPIDIDVSLLNPKVDDPEKLESKFEEIIHDYDENRVQPIDVEKVKKSRIPFLKRKSQQEIDVRGDRSSKMIAARDKLRMRRSSSRSDDVIDGKAGKTTVINIVEDKSKINLQDNVNVVKTANIVSQERASVAQNDVKVVEIGSNDKLEDGSYKSISNNDETVEEVSNNEFVNIEEIICDARNDEDHEKSVNTIETVDINTEPEIQNLVEVNSVEAIDVIEPETQNLVEVNIVETVNVIEPEIQNLVEVNIVEAVDVIEPEIQNLVEVNIVKAIDVIEPEFQNSVEVNIVEAVDFTEPEIQNIVEVNIVKAIDVMEPEIQNSVEVNIVEAIDVIEPEIQNLVEVNIVEAKDVIEPEIQNSVEVNIVEAKDVIEPKIQNSVEVNIVEAKDVIVPEIQNIVEVNIVEAIDVIEPEIQNLVDVHSVEAVDVIEPEIQNSVEVNIVEAKDVIEPEIQNSVEVNIVEAVDFIEPEIQNLVEVNIVEDIDFQDKYNDESDENVTQKVLVSPVIVQNDNLKSIDNYAIDLESFKDGIVTAKSELKEQDHEKPNISIDIKTDKDDVQLEETINLNLSPTDDEFIKLVDTPVSEISTSVINLEITTEQIKEENIYMGSIQIGIPVFDSQVQEHTEERVPEIDVREEPSYTSYYIEATPDKVTDKVEIAEINSEPIVIEVINNSGGSKIVDNSWEEEKLVPKKRIEIEDTKILMKEKDGSIEDIAKLRGKVGRLISRIDANEPVETNKIDIGTELPKQKSVLSKIAMFERHDAEPAFKSKIPRTKLPKLQTANIQTAKKVHIHTPLVVDEVFKPFAKIVHNTKVNNVEITTNGDHVTQIVKAEMAIIESPENIKYDVENKIEIQSNTSIIEESKISEEVLAPVLRQYEPKTEPNEEEETPVIVPKFVPVKDVLKRYESINTNNQTSSKTIVNIPKVKPISEIIKTLKPESSPRSLDAMFSHQPRPVTDILNDLKPVPKDETEASKNTNKVYLELNLNKDLEEDPNEVFESYDKTKHGFKSFKSREYKTLVSIDDNFKSLQYIQDYHSAKSKNEELRKAKSLVELDLGDVVKGKVNKLVVRMNSLDRIGTETKEVSINQKEMPRKRSVSEKIALFERKITPMRTEPPAPAKSTPAPSPDELTHELQAKIADLVAARHKYGTTAVPTITLADGGAIPAIALGTATLDPRLVFHVVCAAIDLGYRAIDTAYIYGNEKAVGEAIRAKINDGTVTRGELFIMSKLWSTFHRRELVAAACEASLAALGLDYFDLYMIHNPMSFKEGGDPIPKIATVLQYSESDYLDAWFGMEALGARARALGLSNFNAAQVQRVLDRARVKPVVNQVECHPYLSQQKLGDFCSERNITLSCYGVLGSKGTPQEYKNGQPAAIDDPLVQVMASGLNVSPAQLLIRYQLQCGRQVVVKSSSAANLYNNLQVSFNLTSAQFDAIRALNRNKRNFTFKGMGDTHKNYPFNEPF